ncbi:50S ribosomal protein L25/general stress protein Ctc [Paenibacillus tarimensis]
MRIPLEVEERTPQSKSDLNQLRNEGKVPGVIYGKKISKAASIAVEEKELLALLRSHPNAVLDVELPSTGKQSVIMTAVQRDPLSKQLLHVDFHQISMNEKVKTTVRIETVGDSAGVKEGGILQQLLHELDIQSLPGRIPESILVDVSQLQMGENILVRDISAPEGVEVRTDPELVVVSVLVPQKDVSEEEAVEREEEAEAAEQRSEEAKMEEV